MITLYNFNIVNLPVVYLYINKMQVYTNGHVSTQRVLLDDATKTTFKGGIQAAVRRDSHNPSTIYIRVIYLTTFQYLPNFLPYTEIIQCNIGTTTNTDLTHYLHHLCHQCTQTDIVIHSVTTWDKVTHGVTICSYKQHLSK